MGQVGRESFRGGDSVWRGAPRTDYSQHDGLQHFRSPAGEQKNRRIVNFAQERWIARIGDRDESRAGLLYLLLLRGGIFKCATTCDTLRSRSAYTGGFQIAARCAEDRFRAAEPVN